MSRQGTVLTAAQIDQAVDSSRFRGIVPTLWACLERHGGAAVPWTLNENCTQRGTYTLIHRCQLDPTESLLRAWVQIEFWDCGELVGVDLGVRFLDDGKVLTNSLLLSPDAVHSGLIYWLNLCSLSFASSG